MNRVIWKYPSSLPNEEVMNEVARIKQKLPSNIVIPFMIDNDFFEA